MAGGVLSLGIPDRDVQYLFRATGVSYVNNACFAWLVWDWILCSVDEWNLIWRKKLSLASGLYISLRLFAFTFQAFNIISMVRRWTDLNFCKGFWWSLAIGTFVHVLLVQLILQGRVYAVYGRDRRVLIGNATLFALSFISIGIVLARQLPRIDPVQVPKPILGCWAGVPKAIASAFIGPAIFEGWLWAMVCYKAYRHASMYARAEGKSIRSGETLMYVLVRDSFLWFSAAAILMFGNIIAFALAGNGFNYMGVPIFDTATCVGGCRLILNVRKAYFAEQFRTTNALGDESFKAAPMPISQLDSHYPELATMEMLDTRHDIEAGDFEEKSVVGVDVDNEKEGGVPSITLNKSHRPMDSEELGIRVADVHDHWEVGQGSGSGSDSPATSSSQA